MHFVTPLLLFASVAVAATVAAKPAPVITANYDNLETDPNFLGGEGEPIPNPYKRLTYSDKVTVIALSEELLSNLIPPSDNNVIQLINVERYTYNRIFSKIDADANFTLRGFSFACAYDLLEEAEPIACELQLECAYNSLSGNSASLFTNYTGTSHFQPVNTKYENLRSCAAVLHRVGDDGNYTQPITVFFDNFQYSTFKADKKS